MSNSPLGSSWEDVKKEIFTPDEIAASNVRVARMGKVVQKNIDISKPPTPEQQENEI